MVKAMIDISEDANAVLNIIKAKHRLKDKSEAINKAMEDYEHYLLEIQPRFIEELRDSLDEPYKEYSSVTELFEILRSPLKKNAKNRSQTRRKKSPLARKKDARSSAKPTPV